MRNKVDRVIRLAGPGRRLYFASPPPTAETFATSGPTIVSWRRSQRHATRFRTARSAYLAFAALKTIAIGRDGV